MADWLNDHTVGGASEPAHPGYSTRKETPRISESRDDVPVWVKLERGPGGHAYADKVFEIIGDLVLDNASQEQRDSWQRDVKGYQNTRLRKKFPHLAGKAIQGALSCDGEEDGVSFWVMGKKDLEEAYTRLYGAGYYDCDPEDLR